MSNLAYAEHYTYDDYKEWEGNWELIDGTPYAMAPAPMIRHQSLAAHISHRFLEQIEECGFCEVLGEVDYKINEDTILRPDVVVTCGEDNEYYLTKAPEIIVEIISKSTALRDERYKFSIYESGGVQYYILVYPDDLRAKIYRLKEGKYIKEGDYLKGKYLFSETTCDIALDFDKVFGRYRKG